MTIEEMQKKIESMIPTPQQIVESLDKKLEKKKEAIETVKQMLAKLDDEETETDE
jgi:hypothetical protein